MISILTTAHGLHILNILNTTRGHITNEQHVSMQLSLLSRSTPLYHEILHHVSMCFAGTCRSHGVLYHELMLEVHAGYVALVLSDCTPPGDCILLHHLFL